MPIPKPTRVELRRAQRAARQRWLQTRNTERAFQRSLTNVARQVGHMVKGFTKTGALTPVESMRIQNMLVQYGQTIEPWARSVVASLHDRVNLREERAWRELAASLGKNIRNELKTVETGDALRGIMQEQVNLITSLPIDAATRIHQLAQENFSISSRGKNIEDMIMRSGQVTLYRARMIARTETARTASVFTEVRAKQIGSPGYWWRSVEDSDVRPLHKKLDGEFFLWDDPPVADESGIRANPGCIWNCRCYPEPVLPEL